MNILITGALKGVEEYRLELEKLGANVYFLQQEKDPLPCDYKIIEAVICNGLFLYHDISRFTALRFIQVTSAGLDRVPLDYTESHGIKLCNARGVYSIPMAEFAVFSVMQFYKQSRFFFKNQVVRKWEKHRELTELSDKKVCIVGCGSVGAETARKFYGFTDNIVGVDLCRCDLPFFKGIYPINELDNVLGEADVIVLTLPLTEDTYHLFDKRRLDALKKGCVLVNIARGGLIDTQALRQCLIQQKLYAALDVFETEPLDNADPLWELDNVILTPHNSFVGDRNSDRLYDLIINNLKEFQNA